ncbi:hypothetical protein [Nocardia sp. NPDC052316]|uniref:hypothetical protein n=1 Tax=Nocardia sp. NPDC052316 TaxID=3364329 RepID=UPI0037CB3B67
MFETRSAPSSTAPFAGLLDTAAAPVCFGYYEQNATDDDTIARCHEPRVGPVGWWNRHRQVGLGVGLMLTGTLGFVPAVQNAILMGL